MRLDVVRLRIMYAECFSLMLHFHEICLLAVSAVDPVDARKNDGSRKYYSTTECTVLHISTGWL